MSTPTTEQQLSASREGALLDATKRLYGIERKQAAIWNRLMVNATGRRRNVLLVWRHVRDHSWKDGTGARLRLEDVAKEFGVSKRTVRYWFQEAVAMTVLEKAGWAATATGRGTRWRALDLPADRDIRDTPKRLGANRLRSAEFDEQQGSRSTIAAVTGADGRQLSRVTADAQPKSDNGKAEYSTAAGQAISRDSLPLNWRQAPNTTVARSVQASNTILAAQRVHTPLTPNVHLQEESAEEVQDLGFDDEGGLFDEAAFFALANVGAPLDDDLDELEEFERPKDLRPSGLPLSYHHVEIHPVTAARSIS